MSEILKDGTIILDTPEDIAAYRLLVLRGAFSLELKGFRRRGRSIYAIVKQEFNLHGNKERVYAQFVDILKQRGILVDR